MPILSGLPRKYFFKKAFPIRNFIIFALLLKKMLPKGGLAQLARALAWHARGHRFESGILHLKSVISLQRIGGFFIFWPFPNPECPIFVFGL
jgi:hypothetical protein